MFVVDIVLDRVCALDKGCDGAKCRVQDSILKFKLNCRGDVWRKGAVTIVEC